MRALTRPSRVVWARESALSQVAYPLLADSKKMNGAAREFVRGALESRADVNVITNWAAECVRRRARRPLYSFLAWSVNALGGKGGAGKGRGNVLFIAVVLTTVLHITVEMSKLDALGS